MDFSPPLEVESLLYGNLNRPKIKNAEIKYVKESATKFVFVPVENLKSEQNEETVPNKKAIAPPIAEPNSNIALHVYQKSNGYMPCYRSKDMPPSMVLAINNLLCGTTIGIIAVLAGSKKLAILVCTKDCKEEENQEKLCTLVIPEL